MAGDWDGDGTDGIGIFCRDSVTCPAGTIAALDAVLSPEWGYRYFSFDPHWAAGKRMASMRNGSGDVYFVVFSAEGTVARGFDHDSELSPWARDDGKVAPGILGSLPRSAVS